MRPFICPVKGCQKAYYHSRSLKKHEKTHETAVSAAPSIPYPTTQPYSYTGQVPVEFLHNVQPMPMQPQQPQQHMIDPQASQQQQHISPSLPPQHSQPFHQSSNPQTPTPFHQMSSATPTSSSSSSSPQQQIVFTSGLSQHHHQHHQAPVQFEPVMMDTSVSTTITTHQPQSFSMVIDPQSLTVDAATYVTATTGNDNNNNNNNNTNNDRFDGFGGGAMV